MTDDEFLTFVADHPVLRDPLGRAFTAGTRTRSSFAVDPVSAAALVALFPVVHFVVTRIGLPWLYEASRYSELWRLKFGSWIDNEYQRHGFEPDAAEAAGEALRRELEQTLDVGARAIWERLAEVLNTGDG